MIGIISYVNPTGIGNMARELRTHLGPMPQLAIPHDGFDPPFDLEWAAGCWLNGCPQDGDPFDLKSYKWEVQRDDLVGWIEQEKIDTVVTVESPFGDNTFRWCKELGVRVALIPMLEWFDAALPAFQGVDMHICTTWQSYQQVPSDRKIYLPWPIDHESIAYRERSGPARLFVHNAGTGGVGERKGTREAIIGFLKAATINADIRLLIRAQKPLEQIMANSPLRLRDEDERIFRERVEVRIGTTPTVSELYSEGDVLIYVPHFDGHALCTLEGMCAGMPVITTDASPMSELGPQDCPLLVPVKERSNAGTINKTTESTVIDTTRLAGTILYCAGLDIGELSRRNRTIVETKFTWNELRHRWINAIAAV